MKNLIEYAVKVLPIVTFFVILTSSIKLAIFYNVFKINIVDYIGVSEYIPLFIDDLHGMLSLVVGAVLAIVTFKVFRIKPHSTEEIKSRIDNKGMRITWIIFTIIILIVAGIASYVLWPTVSEKLERAPGLYVILMCCVFMISTTYKKSSSTLFLIALLSLIFVPLVLSGYSEAYTILENRTDKDYQLFFKRDTIKTSDEIHYLGKSQEYIFMYDSQKKEAIIKLNSSLQEMRITQKVNLNQSKFPFFE